jgi:UDPglucose 6-dehydrogenase
MENARRALPDLELARDPYDAATGADCLAVVTAWDCFRTVDLARLKAAMRHPTVVDGRNLLDPAAMRAAGFTYRGMGRP